MAAFPFFKKKEEPKPKKKAPSVEKTEVKKPAPKKITRKGAYIGSLTSPHVTEKATVLAGKNQYVFRVQPNSTKLTVKQAVEMQYGVDVDKVRMITVPSKKKRLGKIMGVKKGYRKAIVKVREGQSIQILPR
ncbi:MAG: 50S ribosomal protein L23 [Patescibacteria group bacterium]|nr:50S ribosomal protein L23 [Patescibacteria group bacterium]